MVRKGRKTANVSAELIRLQEEVERLKMQAVAADVNSGELTRVMRALKEKKGRIKTLRQQAGKGRKNKKS